MLEIKQGKVIEVLSQRKGLTKIKVKVDNIEKRGISYDDLVGQVEVGDEVILNTTATSLRLGTGGYDFVIYILGKEQELTGAGHIMKLRYTPYQIKTNSVEEQNNPNYKSIKEFKSLNGTPVVVGTLHSMLPAITVAIKENRPETNITYIMTDGAALPLKLSELVYQMQSAGLIDHTITSGHAFGGELEAVNIYSALVAASQINQADIIVITMGPGIVGTGTKYGFSGVEQAEILHAVKSLGGGPIAVPRISFSDSRKRHYGLSHHTRTNLGELSLVKAKIGIPKFNKQKYLEIIKKQLIEFELAAKHQIIYREGEEIISYLDKLDFKVQTMGRNYQQDREYFITAGVAGLLANKELRRG
ncbi:DUF3866 family protein [Natroniella sulfidigena]|uniref:DUF3866 family protein n=1 Tax=Natroniella sulfidigena TaxID=723921 RepID=UPI00200B4E44|nr:DUF3866 family protein [Natroniella sulfidigena]MCK8816606.1 DUF3866 family protein [Natroniella sulfidigena]